MSGRKPAVLVLLCMVVATMVLALGGCGKKAAELTSLTPSSGTAGSQVVLTGVGFGSTQDKSIVRFGSLTAEVGAWSDTSVEIKVPAAAAAGAYAISVETSGGVGNSLQFQVTETPPPTPPTPPAPPAPPAKPRLTSMIPTSGPSGTKVYVYGTSFGGTRGQVNLGPVKFEISSWSDAKIEAIVPPAMGAGQYEVTVQNANGTSNALQFLVTPQEDPGQSQEEAIYDYATAQGINPGDYVYVQSKTSAIDPTWALYDFQRYEGMQHIFFLLQGSGTNWMVVASGADDFNPQSYGAPADLKF
jgi:hypothetical protein